VGRKEREPGGWVAHRVVATLAACAIAGLVAAAYAAAGLAFGSASPGFVIGWTCLALVVGFLFGTWIAALAPPALLGFFLLLFLAGGRGTAGELFDASFALWAVGVSAPMGVGVWLRGRFHRVPDEGDGLLDRWSMGR